MPTIAITGAASGIGAAFLSHYSKDASNTIHAIDVSWPSHDTSSTTNHSTPAAKIHKHAVNTSDPTSLTQLSDSLTKIHTNHDQNNNQEQPQKIDLLIHSAAVRCLVPALVEKGVQNPKEAETWEVMDKPTMETCLSVNVVGSFLLIKTLLPFLLAPPTTVKSKVIIMTSRMGSLTANHDGGSYAYRASKAGLNALIKSFSVDVPEIKWALLHPGRVDSNMTHVREEGSVSADEAVGIMVRGFEGGDFGLGDGDGKEGGEGDPMVRPLSVDLDAAPCELLATHAPPLLQ